MKGINFFDLIEILKENRDKLEVSKSQFWKIPFDLYEVKQFVVLNKENIINRVYFELRHPIIIKEGDEGNKKLFEYLEKILNSDDETLKNIFSIEAICDTNVVETIIIKNEEKYCLLKFFNKTLLRKKSLFTESIQFKVEFDREEDAIIIMLHGDDVFLLENDFDLVKELL